MYVALKGKLIPHCKNQTQPCPNVETAHCSYNIQRTTSYSGGGCSGFYGCHETSLYQCRCSFWQFSPTAGGSLRTCRHARSGNWKSRKWETIWEQDRDGNRIEMGTGTGTRTKKLRNTTMGFKFHLQFGPVT